MKTRSNIYGILAAFGLALASVGMVSAVPVTFQVDLSVQTSLGNFDPASHTLEVHGSFDGWGAGALLSPSQGNANVYQGTVEVSGAAGTAVQYKFVLNQSGTLVWENNGVGPNGAQNRMFDLSASAQTLPVANFNNQATAPGVVNVTFQVNLEIQKSIGNFDPANHTVEVHGSFDNWGAGMMLSASSTNTNVYKGTVEITGSPGAPFEYKFVINQEGTLVWEGNVGSGGGFANRTLTLGATEQLMPVVYFNNLTANPGAGLAVTFRVNMGVQTALGLFDPAIGTMNLAGEFNNWNTTATPLTNTPTAPTVYSGTVNIKSSAGSTIPFKFVANGGTWETGNNRTYLLEAGSQSLPILFFNNLADLGSLTILRSSATEITVSWTAGPGVRLQRSSSVSGGWQDVPDSLGLDTMAFPVANGNLFLRLAGP